MTKKERIAYAAGIIDGEAYVGIKKDTWGMRNRKDIKNPTYHERIQIRMNCKEVLEFLQSEFGGKCVTEPRIYQSKSGFKSRKIMNIYRVTDLTAANIIKKVRPYLIEKRLQADAILALRKSKESAKGRRRGCIKGRTMPQEVLDEREALYQSIRAIHRK